jgi:hypothetical protein
MHNKKHDEIRSIYLLYTGEIFEVKRRKAFQQRRRILILGGGIMTRYRLGAFPL